MESTYTYNSIDQPELVVYKKGKSVWYSDAVTSSIHGQWLEQETTLGKDKYSYDQIGRLTEAQEAPNGKGCTTSMYTYDDSSNRTSETTRAPGAEGKCAANGGTSASHAYDSAGRLADPGTVYEPLGAATTVSGADAGGEPLVCSYYASGALYTQSQQGTTNTYSLDPSGRRLETASESIESSTSTISHYAGAGSTPSWTERTGGVISRNIDGVNGVLCGVQSGPSTVTFDIVNLHGDVVGTALDSAKTKVPTLTSEPTAFGVPTAKGESSYQWLGAGGLTVELESGIASDGHSAYVPQLALHLQTEVTGSALQDPVNEYLSNTKEASPIGETNATSPGAVEPVFVPESVINEFWEHPPWNRGPEGSFEDDPKFKAQFCAGSSTVSWDSQDPTILLFVTSFHCTESVYVRAWNFAGPEETEKFEHTGGKPIKNGLFTGEINLLLDSPFPADLGVCIETRRGRPGTRWGPLQCFPFELPAGFAGP
jgi:hypothetical protein